MRVLVTGANGFAGRHVVSHLLRFTDWKIAAVDIQSFFLDDLRVDSYTHDFREQPEPNDFGNVDAVIHLAASSDVPSFLAEPAKHVLNNVLGTVNLLQWARFQDLKMFIQVSTNEVYGPGASPSFEWDELHPSTPYSASKAAQEMMALAWRASFDTPTVIINTSHLFGEGQPATKFIPTVVRNVLLNESVPIYGRRAGYVLGDWESSVRNWTYVGDFAHALHFILTSDYEITRLNVAGPAHDCLAVAEKVADHLCLPLSVEWQNSREARPGYEHEYVLNTDLIERHGYAPAYGFDEGIKRTVDWFRSKENQPK